MDEKHIKHLKEQDLFSELDIHFARLMMRLSGDEEVALFLASALVSRATTEGHVCLDLSGIEGKPLATEAAGRKAVACPGLEEWLKKLDSSSVVGKPGDYRPLILDDHSRLYLYRYWQYEKSLADNLRERVTGEIENIEIRGLKESFSKLFVSGQREETNWHKLAAFVCLMKRFCVISGGPGTGKSTLIHKILALLLEQSGGREMRIALAAPTGKAAARLQEATNKGREEPYVKGPVKEAIPVEASTIHRLLGPIQGSPYFRHNKENPLPADLIVVDEASMVDLALMSKLAQAVSPHARLLLLGDKDQLASVEAGAVLGDICHRSGAHDFSQPLSERYQDITGESLKASTKKSGGTGIGDCVVQLRENYRFGPHSGIGKVSRAVNQGDGERVLGLFKGGQFDDIKWHDLPAPNGLHRELRERILHGYKPYLEAHDPIEAFRLFERFRLICALRKGPYGVSTLNLLAERILREEGLIHPEERWYHGRPLLITRNDYNLGLFNGDMGIILPDPQAGNDLRAFFQSQDGTLRKFLPQRLPEHETLFAMTMHKSQGSEFDEVLLILPDRHSPVLTRELIYTGITRAKEQVEVWAKERVFLEGVSQRIKRSSGLRDALWGT